jgi:hypothetical protein
VKVENKHISTSATSQNKRTQRRSSEEKIKKRLEAVKRVDERRNEERSK